MSGSTSPPPVAPPPLPPSTPPPQPQDSDHNESFPTSSMPTPSNLSTPKPVTALESTVAPQKKVAPLPWNHVETINLIQAYQDKWYSLKRGQLKAGQWEEVAVTVAARCGYDEPSKSSIQCRHKIEKLRKRYRSEKLKRFPNFWPYFELMASLERGPLPISAQPMTGNKAPKSDPVGENEGSDSDTEANFGYVGGNNKSDSYNHNVRGNVHDGRNMSRAFLSQGFEGGNERPFRASRKPMLQKRMKHNESEEDDDEEEEDEEEEEEVEGNGKRVKEAGGGEMMMEIAEEIRAFAHSIIKMENKKMEMMRDMERYWMEMENKRMEMIIESQRKIVDSIGKAFGSCKKMKIAQGT